MFALYKLLLTYGLYRVFPPLFLVVFDLAMPPLYTLFSSVQFLYRFAAASTDESVGVKVNPIMRTNMESDKKIFFIKPLLLHDISDDFMWYWMNLLRKGTKVLVSLMEERLDVSI